MVQVIKVYFDGGCGIDLYGSWEVVFPDGTKVRTSRETYTDKRTCNVAEYRSLISALTYLQQVRNKEATVLEIWGDSNLVINQLRFDGWKCKKPHLQLLREQARTLLAKFQDWSTNWHRRSNNVIRFGH